MNELITLKTSEGGKKTVSARELHEFLEIRKDFTDWFKYRVSQYEFEEGKDFSTILGESTGGRPSKDFELTLETAKELSMVENNKRGREARKYFIQCENALKENVQVIPKLSKEIQAIFVLDEKQQKLESDIKEFRNDFTDYKENSPLFSIECEELQAAVRKKGINILGGKDAKAYKDKPLRTKLYSDIQREIKRQFGLHSYKALKRSQLDIALEIVSKYSSPLILLDEITLLNNQVQFRTGCPSNSFGKKVI